MSSNNSLPPLHRARWLFAVLVVVAAHVVIPVIRAQESVIQFDASQTKIEYTLPASFHTVHGTFKLKDGTIRFNPSTGAVSGIITVDATSGDSGNDGRDRKMHREILESDAFPEINFTPNRLKGALAAEGTSDVEVAGKFRLRGQDHDVTLPVEIKSSGPELQLSAHLIIPYVQWGVKNPSTFVLRVSDKVTIEIHAVGHVTNSAASP